MLYICTLDCIIFKMFVFPPSHTNSLAKEAVHTTPTIGSNVEEIIVRNTHFLIWDIGGQENLRASWYSYYGNTEVRINACLRLLCARHGKMIRTSQKHAFI